MRKFSVAFRKLFREISHFYRENKAKFREDIFAKCEHFVKTMSLTAATNNCRKELVEFCYDISWFEVLLCHMNNFSSFTLIIVWICHLFLKILDFWGFFVAQFQFFSPNFCIIFLFTWFSRAKEMRKWSELVAKIKTIFLFAWNPRFEGC